MNDYSVSRSSELYPTCVLDEAVLASDSESEDSCVFVDHQGNASSFHSDTYNEIKRDVTKTPGNARSKTLINEEHDLNQSCNLSEITLDDPIPDISNTSNIDNSVFCVDETNICEEFQSPLNSDSSIDTQSKAALNASDDSDSFLSESHSTEFVTELESDSSRSNDESKSSAFKNCREIILEDSYASDNLVDHESYSKVIYPSHDCEQSNESLGATNENNNTIDVNSCADSVDSVNFNSSGAHGDENVKPSYCAESDSSDEETNENAELDSAIKRKSNHSKHNCDSNEELQHRANVTCRRIIYSSSDSDDQVEHFLSKMKIVTEKKKMKCRLSWDDDFIDDDSSSSVEEGYHLSVRQKLFPSESTPVLIASENSENDLSNESNVKYDHLKVTPEPNAPVFLTPEPDAPVFSTPENCSNDDLFSSQANVLQDINIGVRSCGKFAESTANTKVQSYDFLSSLSPNVPNSKKCPAALPYLKSFKGKSKELARKIFNIFNEDVFKNQLPQDMEIKWKVRLTKTAGLCVCMRNTSANNGRTAMIELSSKVIDSAYRLRDTLLHEMCHAATWIIYGFQDGHGKLWKFWAQEAVRVFPNIPIPTVCHSYEINTKYSYKCDLCGSCVGRHSKSLDTERKRCGRCGGKFQLTTPLRIPSKFALFVKDNYGSVKKSNQKSKHGEIMRLLGAEFSNKAKINDD